MSSPKYSNHHCRLTDPGYKKFKAALSDSCLNNLSDVKLGETLGCYRSNIARLRNNSFVGKRDVLKKVFQSLQLHLEETDYEQVPYYNTETQNQTALKLDETTLFKQALLSLNYIDQSRLFEDFWNLDTSPQIGAFLVRGKAYSGQRWLLHRLLHEFRLDTTAHKFPIVLPQTEVYIEDLWTRLSDKLHLNRNASSEEIVQRLYLYWQEGTVVLLLENLEYLYETEAEKILQELWQPLVKLLKQHPQACNSYFIMFLVDNCGNFGEGRLEWATLKTWQTEQILDLKPIGNFSEVIITNWLKEHRRLLSNLLPESSDNPNLGKNVWQQSREGIPELVMLEICKHYRHDWHQLSNNS